MNMAGKPKLLVVSHVLPFPRNAGQNQRVYFTLAAARTTFHVSFLTVAASAKRDAVRRQLLELCDDAIVLPARYHAGTAARMLHHLVGMGYAAARGLKLSNYVVGALEFTPNRVATALDGRTFDAALFEYWHAYKAADALRSQGIPTVLDMHDILWRSFERQWTRWRFVPAAIKQRYVQAYRAREEESWRRFDALIAINRQELEYVRPRVPGNVEIFYAPMGTDLDLWPFAPKPADPPRVAYYGGLSSKRNQEGALQCLHAIMPQVWRRYPSVQFWMVGSNPPAFLKALESDPRVRVTGTVENPAEVLRTMTCVLCPWEGAFGFRSRLIEVMALGVPVLATPDAAAGMDLEAGEGILFGASPDDLASATLRLLDDPCLRACQSRSARAQVERKFSLQNTYGRLVTELERWLAVRREGGK